MLIVSVQIGELLRDWRRINVSFTRAKKKLIIIGSKSTLSADDCLLSDFFSLIEERKWILDLPRNAPVLHAQKPNTGSPTTAVKTRSSPSKVGGAKLSASLVDSKPFIRDILNVSMLCHRPSTILTSACRTGCETGGLEIENSFRCMAFNKSHSKITSSASLRSSCQELSCPGLLPSSPQPRTPSGPDPWRLLKICRFHSCRRQYLRGFALSARRVKLREGIWRSSRSHSGTAFLRGDLRHMLRQLVTVEHTG